MFEHEVFLFCFLRKLFKLSKCRTVQQQQQKCAYSGRRWEKEDGEDSGGGFDADRRVPHQFVALWGLAVQSNCPPNT